MIYRNDLSASFVRAILSYDRTSGKFTWLNRGSGSASDKRFNLLFSGKQAGQPDKRGYIRIKINGTRYAAHRLAWLWVTGEWPIEEVDHRNHDKGDNRFDNLRAATHSQNHANVSVKSNNKLGIKGVCFKPRQGFHAQIKKDGKVISLGHYATVEAASAAYVKGARELHGEFAWA